MSEESPSVSDDVSVESHSTVVVVWDTPDAIECGERFTVKLGVKCSAECPPHGWAIEVRDHDGATLATAAMSDEPWQDTAALYYAEVEFTAPEAEGLHAWEAKFPETAGAVREDDTTGATHGTSTASFNVRTVPKPECLLKVVAIDQESQAPIKGAKVVIHPYRAFTNEDGVAEVRIPKGEYRLFVSGGDYFPFRSDGEVTTDTTIRAELAQDLGPSDAELWS